MAIQRMARIRAQSSPTWDHKVSTGSGQHSPPVSPHPDTLNRPATASLTYVLHCTHTCVFSRKFCSIDSIAPPFCVCTLTACTLQRPLKTTIRAFAGDAPLLIIRYEAAGSDYCVENTDARFVLPFLHYLLGMMSWRASWPRRVTLWSICWFTDVFAQTKSALCFVFRSRPCNSTFCCAHRRVLSSLSCRHIQCKERRGLFFLCTWYGT